MNTHTTNRPAKVQSHAILGDLRSPLPSLLDTVLERIKKPGDDTGKLSTLPSATIVMTPDFTAIRSIVTGRRVMVTGFYNSRKAGRALPYEGMNELALLKCSEVDPRVVDYRSQPFRFEFVIRGLKRVYIADCVRLLADGTVEVIEVKGDARQLAVHGYAEKLQAVLEVCEGLGWRFRTITQKQLFKPAHVFANVNEIQSRRMVRFSQVEAYRAVEALEQVGGEATLGYLVEMLGNTPRDLAITKAMMVQRLIAIDISVPLSASSQVSLVSVQFGMEAAR